ncbi:MAG: hypothetical protein H7832_09345 [Magnetococcus sp. DMHC-6]
MIVSGVLLPPGEAPSVKPELTHNLVIGDRFMARVAQMGDNGRGVFRFQDGSTFSFSNGDRGLMVGERVALEVVRLTPEIAFRMTASQGSVAASLAASAEQSLVRAPDVFAKILSLAGFSLPAESSSLGVPSGGVNQTSLETILQALRQSFAPPGEAPFVLTEKGESLASLLQKMLPNISGESLLKGDWSSLVQLLERGSRDQIAEVIKHLKLATANLRWSADEETVVKSGHENPAAEIAAAKGALHRLGELLAMQEVLPKSVTPDGHLFLGYRVFWFAEGGMGEAMWVRERQKGGGARGGGGGGGDHVVALFKHDPFGIGAGADFVW